MQKVNEKAIKVGAIGLNIAGTILTGGSLAGAETAGSALLGVFGVTTGLTGAITSSLSLGSELVGKKEMAEKVDKGFSQIFAKGFGASEKTEKIVSFGENILNLSSNFNIKSPGTWVSGGQTGMNFINALLPKKNDKKKMQDIRKKNDYQHQIPSYNPVKSNQISIQK